LLNKEYEGSSSTYQVDVFLETIKGRVGIIFLHVDDLNYFALEINGEENGDVRLI